MNAFRVLLALMAGLIGTILVLPLLLLIAPFLLVLILNRTIARWIEPAHMPDQEIIEFDPYIGWKARPFLNTYHLADDVYRLTTDSDGWRGKTKLSESDLVVFGDSFVFGHAIGDRHFFADLNPRLRVKAIGVAGYNLVQGLLWMNRLSSQIRNKLIVWFIFVGNDLFETLQVCMEGYRTPFVRQKRGTDQWEIVSSHLSPAPWPSGTGYYRSIFMEQLAGLFVPGPYSRRVFSACEYLIGEADRTIREAGSRLVVVSIPTKRQLSAELLRELKGYLPDASKFDPDLPDKLLAEICSSRDLPFVAGKDYLDSRDYREFEVHWNERGNRRIAKLLKDLHLTYAPTKVDRASVETREAAII
jgi:hypothetical protein